MKIQHFHDKATGTLTYVVHIEGQPEAIVVDPVWNFDFSASKFSTESYGELKSYIKANSLKPVLILETHVHADHVTGSQLVLKDWPKTPIMIGARIPEVQKVFGQLFNSMSWFKADGSQFDYLMADGDEKQIGPFKIKAYSAPGHTPVDTIYQIGDCLFVGDLIFMPDSGTGRCDFPGGDAEKLFLSVHEKLYRFPDHFKIYTGHDYQPGGRELKFMCTVGESKALNIHIQQQTVADDYVKFRQARDKTLDVPKLILPSLQINMNAGVLPPADTNGQHYLKFPLSGTGFP